MWLKSTDKCLTPFERALVVSLCAEPPVSTARVPSDAEIKRAWEAIPAAEAYTFDARGRLVGPTKCVDAQEHAKQACAWHTERIQVFTEKRAQLSWQEFMAHLRAADNLFLGKHAPHLLQAKAAPALRWSAACSACRWSASRLEQQELVLTPVPVQKEDAGALAANMKLRAQVEGLRLEVQQARAAEAKQARKTEEQARKLTTANERIKVLEAQLAAQLTANASDARQVFTVMQVLGPAASWEEVEALLKLAGSGVSGRLAAAIEALGL